MSLAPVPEFADIVKEHLRRSEWGQFPDVVIHAEESLINWVRHRGVGESGYARLASPAFLLRLAVRSPEAL